MGMKNIFRKNKSILISSAIACVFTLAVTAGIFGTLIATDVIELNTSSTKTPTAAAVASGTAVENSKIMSAVAKAEPAVVSIIITKDVATVEQYYQQYNPFSGLYGNSTDSDDEDSNEQEIGGGSGFFVSSDGYIVTNNHVVSDTTADYTVMTSDGTKYAAKILDTDSTMDVAILKVEGKDFPFLTFADSSTLKLGQTTIAIGNALAEFQNSISMGIVSGLSRSITASDSSTGSSEKLDDVIQTDAAINSGNSGGPLLDIQGNVIGVNVAVETTANSIGFALPSNIVKSIADSVKQYGEIVKPYLGIRYTLVTDSIKKSNNLSVDYGALISKGSSSSEPAVISDSPADKAGIKEGDVILEIDGTKITEDNSVTSVIRQKEIGQTVTIKILRDGATKEVKAKLEKAPSDL